MYLSTVFLSVIGVTVFTSLLTAHSREPPQVKLPKNSSMSCEEVINSVKIDLVGRGYFIPWKTLGPQGKLIQPQVLVDKNLIQKNYYDYPVDRSESVVFRLSGDMNKLYSGLMSSPQLMATLSAQIMAECDQVGLVEFAHWFEGFKPVGYFPDNTARTFTWVDPGSSSPYERSVKTPEGSRVVFQWGYYFAP